MTSLEQLKSEAREKLEELIQWETPEHEKEVKTYIDTLITTAYKAGNKRTVEEWYLGKKVNVFDGEYIVVGLSQMIYDEECEGEPEWKITKEIQEVAIAKEYDKVTFQKPSWHTITQLQAEVNKNNNLA